MNDLYGPPPLQQALLFMFMQIQIYSLAFLLCLYTVDITLVFSHDRVV